MKWLLVISLIGCGGHGEGGPLDGNNPTGDSGSGLQCGGFVAAQCPTNEFCDFPTNTCGGTDESGICRTKPSGCDDSLEPVCGCDGVVHGNPCEAAAAGVDINANGTCTVEQGQFACGFAVCTLASDFCQHSSSDVGGEPDGFACQLLPQACGSTPTCGCLASEPCGDFCTGSAAEGLTLVCPGG